MWIDIIVIQWTLEVASILIIVCGSHDTAPDVGNKEIASYTPTIKVIKTEVNSGDMSTNTQTNVKCTWFCV